MVTFTPGLCLDAVKFREWRHLSLLRKKRGEGKSNQTRKYLAFSEILPSEAVRLQIQQQFLRDVV